MRSIDGITSSKIGKAILKQVRDHQALFEWVLIISILLVSVLVWSSFFATNNPLIVPSTAVIIQHPNSKAGDNIIGSPEKILAPSVKLSAAIEQVGLTKKNAMAVPSNTDNAGWYQYGPKPGETGNAVITGHVDTLWLQPAVFANIDQLKTGEQILITDENNKTYTFAVQKVVSYPLKELPLENIFGSSTEKNLNLITCSGKWSWKIGSYTERTVVYTKIVPQPTD